MKYKIAFATVQGKGHIQEDIPCQDRVSFAKTDDTACIALADGAGSRPFSHFGAEIITKNISKYLVECFDYLYELDSELIKDIIISECHNYYKELPYIPDDLASTLLFFVVKNDKYIIGHIGDGMIFQVSEDVAQVLSYPENGEEMNQTYFISSQNAINHLRIKKGIINLDMTIIMGSDGGCMNLYSVNDEKVADAVIKMDKWMSRYDEETICNSLETNMKNLFIHHTLDDMSIIILKIKIDNEDIL